MPEFDKLQRCGFDGLQFPIKSISIKGRYRHHEHEYLRVPGAIIEKLERAVYNIEIHACFDTNIKGYGRLWPDGVNALRLKYESGLTSGLVIPTIGTVPAFQPEWDQSIDIAKVRSGETIKLSFKEDQTQRFLAAALVKTQQQSMADSLQRFNVTRAQILGVPANDQNIFDKIQGAANKVLAVKDQADLYGGLLAAKLAGLTRIMREADSALESFKHPQNYQALDAFFELWNATVQMSTNLAESPRGPRLYTTPRQMSVTDIAAAVYGGSTERAPEIMLNNRLDDAFAVLAGTKITYFVDAGLIAA
jgi:hypothetical protein